MTLLPPTDLETITNRLNRPPNPVEEGCFLNLWSEHCSYRSSIRAVTMIETDKNFDAVRMMRGIRDGLSRRYIEDPSAEGRDLQEIRKYGIKV